MSESAQNAVPEPVWTWRRIYVFAGQIAALALLTVAVLRMPDEHLWIVTLGLIALIALRDTYYLVAPSLEYVVRVHAIARGLVSGGAP